MVGTGTHLPVILLQSNNIKTQYDFNTLRKGQLHLEERTTIVLHLGQLDRKGLGQI